MTSFQSTTEPLSEINHINTNNESNMNFGIDLLTLCGLRKSKTEASTVAYFNQMMLGEGLPEEQSQTCSSETPTTVVLLGDGENIMDSSIINSLENVKNKSRKIETLVLAEVEISADILHDLLTFLKPDLKSLYLLRVPLDHDHLETLNELELDLQFLGISYVEADQSHTFKKKQQKQEEYKPFDINKLNFKRLGRSIKYIKLQGVTLKKETIDTLIETYSDSVEILILERLKSVEKSKKALLEHILQKIHAFTSLKGFSFERNKLDSINFSEDDEEEQEENINLPDAIKFPNKLEAVNFNYCNLDDKQVRDLVDKFKESQCPLKAFHLVGSRLYPRTLEAVSKFGKESCSKGEFLLEVSKPPIDPSGKDLFNDHKSKTHAIRPKIIEIFQDLPENSTILETLKSSEPKPEWMGPLSKKSDFAQLLPYLLKLIREVKSFTDACQYNRIDFSTKSKLLIPKYDFNELLNKIAKDSNGTLVLGDSPIVGEYNFNLIRHIHPTFLRDDDWAKQPLKNQRDQFLELMKKLGCNHLEKKHKDCFEDQFIMALQTSKHVSYDCTLATFSLFWYYNQVSVKFNLSDDWYLDRKQRKNRYALPTQDFLINFCSEWNSHTNDFVFELEILNDGEPEVKFKSSIWKDGDLNVAKALLIAIDKGFVMLKALNKMELFEKGEAFKGVEDSRKVRRVLKEKLKKYAKSRDFQNLLRQEKTLLPEEVEGEQHYSD